MQENKAVNICQMNRTIVEIFLIMIMQDQFQASEFATCKGPHFLLEYLKTEAYGIQNSLVSNIPLVSAHHLTSQ